MKHAYTSMKKRAAVIKREQSSVEQTESIWERGMGVLPFSLKASFNYLSVTTKRKTSSGKYCPSPRPPSPPMNHTQHIRAHGICKTKTWLAVCLINSAAISSWSVQTKWHCGMSVILAKGQHIDTKAPEKAAILHFKLIWIANVLTC